MPMREYFIDFTNPDEAARQTLQMHIDTLVSLRNSTGNPEELEWEIRLYEYILQDPAKRLKAYQDARYGDDNSLPLEKRDVVKILGWIVP